MSKPASSNYAGRDMFQPLSLFLCSLWLSSCAVADSAGLVALSANAASTWAQAQDLPVHRVPRRPSLSPDGSRVAYSHGGDIWVADVASGRAERLTAHPGYDTSPLWSPDGLQIAFAGRRHGNFDVYLMSAAGGEPQRLTWHSENESLHSWIQNQGLLIGMTRDRWYNRYGRGKGLWSVDLEGGTPRLVGDFPANRSTVSADGRWICYERGSGDIRRRAYRGTAADMLWLYDTQTGSHTQLTDFDGSDLCPQFGDQDQSVYFLSDRVCAGNEQGRNLGLWKISRDGGEASLVYHPGADLTLRYCSMSADGSRIVSELQDGFVVIDPATGQATKLTPRGGSDPSIPEQIDVTVSGGASELALSPDGETIVFSARGDLYALRKHDKIERAARLTQNAADDSNPVWVEKGKALLFLSERDGNAEIYKIQVTDEEVPFYQARDFKLTRLTQTDYDESQLDLSPDGKRLAWVQGNGRFVVGDPNTLAVTRVLYEGFEGPGFSWSPDSEWLAFSVANDDFNAEVFLARASIEGLAADDPGFSPYNLTAHPDDDTNPVWSPDGRKLVFTSKRRMLDETDAWVCYLRKEDVEMTERERLEAAEVRAKAKKEKAKKDKSAKEKAKKDQPQTEPANEPATEPEPEPEPATEPEPEPAIEPAAAAEPAEQGKPDQDPEADAEDGDEEEQDQVDPVVIDFDGLRDRLRRLTRNEGNESAMGWNADSDKVYYNATVGTRLTNSSEAETGFYEIEIYDHEAKQLESSPVSSFRTTDKAILYVKSGKVVERTSKAQTYPFSVRVRLDRQAIRRAVMDQAWRVLDRWFYDTNFHGVDWQAELAKWEPVILASSTPEDFEDFMNWLLGELNASHMGYRSGATLSAAETDRTSTGDLGVIWDYSFTGAGMKVLEVLDHGPAARDSSRLTAGDRIVAVNGFSMPTNGNFDRLMAGTSGQETVLDVIDSAGQTREVLIRPGSTGQTRALLYERREQRLRKQVETDSDNRLGYVHIQAMGTASLVEFERELYAAGHGKDALIIDVRDNGGGWTTDMVLSMLMVNDHAFTIPRGGGVGYPQGRRIFATWNKPVVVLCNENSYSNAEIFSWAIKTLKRGPLVGKQTFGAVISTGGAGLLDGSFIRMPFRGWYVNDAAHTNMELNGCPPDFPVEFLPGDYAIERDRQVEKAIEVGLSLVQ
jgi:tricorn protease